MTFSDSRLSRTALLSLLSFLFLLGGSAAAAETLPWPDLGKAADRSPGGGDRDAALLVAIERYPFLEDKPIAGAKRNLNDWQLYLTKTRGVPSDKVILLRDDQATREKILSAASEVSRRVQPGGTVWFLFVGHGAPAPGRSAGGLLLGVDTQNEAESLSARGVPQDELMAALGAGQQASTVAILDSCFSGRSSTGAPLVAGLQPIMVTKINAVTSGAVLLAAAQGNEYAGPLPGGDRPAFSYLMLAALRGWGDIDHDGRVTVSEAVQYTRRALQTLLVGRQQNPDIDGPGETVAVASTGETGPDFGDWQRQGTQPVSSGSKGLATLGWVTGAVGLASVGAGVFSYYKARSYSDQVSSDPVFDPDAESSGKRWETMQIVFYSLGAGALVTTALLWTLPSASSEPPKAAGLFPIVSPGMAGLGAQGTF